MKTATILIAALLAGCTAAAPESADDLPEPLVEATDPVVLIDTNQAWPTVPGDPGTIPFTVPAGMTSLEVRFNWRGQSPGGISSNREAAVVSPDGEERIFTGPDLPANPYACASQTCGPPDDKVEWFDAPTAGAWRVELRGIYTATAYVVATAMPYNATAPAGDAQK